METPIRIKGTFVLFTPSFLIYFSRLTVKDMVLRPKTPRKQVKDKQVVTVLTLSQRTPSK